MELAVGIPHVVKKLRIKFILAQGGNVTELARKSEIETDHHGTKTGQKQKCFVRPDHDQPENEDMTFSLYLPTNNQTSSTNHVSQIVRFLIRFGFYLRII